MIKLFRFLKPYTSSVILVLLFMVGQALAELYLPTLMSDIVNNGMIQGNTPYIIKYGIYMIIVALLSSAWSIAGSFLSARVAIGMGKDIRNSIFTRVESYSMNEFNKIGTASLLTRTTNDIIQVQTVMVMMMRFLIYAPVMCVGGIVMAFTKDKVLSIVLVVVLPLLILTIALIARKVVPIFKSLQKKLDKVNLVLRENLIGIRVIRAFNRLEVEKERFNFANKDLTDTSIRVNQIMAAMQPVMLIFMNITTIAIIWFASLRININKMEVGDMMAFIQYAMQIMFSVIMVSIMYVMVPRAQVSAERINEVLEIEPEILDPEEAKAQLAKKGLVEFRNVTFTYPGAEQPAISKISFESMPGEVTAIIGGTGSGKSTLISLIPRFYDVTEGSILVDGLDVRDLTQHDLRAKIGFVPQTAVLFSGSIKDNISYGKNDATDEEIKHAAEVAQASDFILNMKDGYDSIIAQGGTNISGGQKQRLSIARALVRKPEIYIFDDSFSALDYKTDACLRKALKHEIADSTAIIVAQRVSTVMDADKIIVLDEGEIVGIGNHKELLQTCEIYHEIVSSQLSEEEIA